MNSRFEKREKAQEALLRRAMRGQIDQNDAPSERLVRLALDDVSVFSMLYETAMNRAKAFGDSTSAFQVVEQDGTVVVDNLLKLLQWFVNNGRMLVEVTEQIAGLFGGVDSAIEVCAAESLFDE